MPAEKEIKSPVSERGDRLKKLVELKGVGLNPYPAQAQRDYLISQVLSDFSALEKAEKTFYVAGRLRSIRSHGNLTFAKSERQEFTRHSISKIKVVWNRIHAVVILSGSDHIIFKFQLSQIGLQRSECFFQ